MHPTLRWSCDRSSGLLYEIRARGAVAYRRGGDVAACPASALAADLPAWIISTSSDGDMRLIVASPPPWPDAVLAAAVLVELIDHHHRSGQDTRAESAAERLEVKLAELRAEGIEAWLAS